MTADPRAAAMEKVLTYEVLTQAYVAFRDAPDSRAKRNAMRAVLVEALLALPVAETGWQSIDTFDGRKDSVLVWWPFWCKTRPVVATFGYKGIQQWFAAESLEGDGDPPTHWMPLPAPPEPPEGEQAMTPTDPDIIFYGPHPCEDCGVIIAKASREQGGEAFDYPEGPIYPNTPWTPHVHRPVSADEKKVRLMRPNIPAPPEPPEGSEK